MSRTLSILASLVVLLGCLVEEDCFGNVVSPPCAGLSQIEITNVDSCDMVEQVCVKNLGDLRVGAEETYVIGVASVGEVDLVVRDVSSDSPRVVLDQPFETTVVGVASKIDVQLSVTPDSAGAGFGSVLIESDAHNLSDDPVLTLELSWTGVE